MTSVPFQLFSSGWTYCLRQKNGREAKSQKGSSLPQDGTRQNQLPRHCNLGFRRSGAALTTRRKAYRGLARCWTGIHALLSGGMV